MSDSPFSPTPAAIAWEQLSFLKDDLVEVTLRLGFVLSANHLQFQITARDPSSGMLLAMVSSPSRAANRWESQLTIAVEQLREIIRDHVDPF